MHTVTKTECAMVTNYVAINNICEYVVVEDNCDKIGDRRDFLCLYDSTFIHKIISHPFS